MYDYDGCAQFVADYLTFEPLDPPIDLVGIVYITYKLYIEALIVLKYLYTVSGVVNDSNLPKGWRGVG